MLSPLEMLDWVEALLSDPKNWVQNWCAVNDFGNEVPPCDESASRWCLVGGVWSVVSVVPENFYFSDLNRIAQEKGFRDCADLNDSTDHETVLDLIREAREALAVED